MRTRIHDNAYFFIILGVLSLSYLGFECFFNHYAMISVDEFWFAHRIYQYKEGLPYRDFAPYKTILGYYLLLPIMLLSDGIMQTLLALKDYLAVLNALIIFGASVWLSRFFSRAGILASVALLFASDIALSYSTNIRVDLLGYWFGLFSLLCLLEKRYISAGLLIGLGFITTQKVAWYLLASNGALALYYLFLDRHTNTILRIVQFNFFAFLIIAIYLVIWSTVTSTQLVIGSVFREAEAMYHLNWYDHARYLFWSLTLIQNAVLFLLWPFTAISLFITYPTDTRYKERFLITTYALIILLCLIPYKQVFPYYMQVTLPVFLVLYAAFFSWLFGLLTTQAPLQLRAASPILSVFIFCYLALLILTITSFQLPSIYLLLGILPCSLFFLIQIKQAFTLIHLYLISLTLFFIGALYPLAIMSIKMPHLNSAYQKANMQAINTLLQDGSEYVAGIELIYNKDQHVPGMRHLMGPAIDYLSHPKPALRRVMLASLYEDPNATIVSAISAMQSLPVKFYVNNYRMMALSPRLKQFLHKQYAHWWGSIYLYAPTISSGRRTMNLVFSGRYFIQAPKGTHILLNGRAYAAGTFTDLPANRYLSIAPASYRLRWVPSNLSVDPKFKQDAWWKMVYSGYITLNTIR